jgi:dihydrofolate reductase
MALIRLYMTMSVDGFVVGPEDGVDAPMGIDGFRRFNWLDRRNDPGPSGQVFAEVLATREIISGRGTYELAGRWQGDHHGGVPVFVLTHGVPDEPPPGSVRFVTDVGECAALAGDGDVMLHGAGGGAGAVAGRTARGAGTARRPGPARARAGAAHRARPRPAADHPGARGPCPAGHAPALPDLPPVNAMPLPVADQPGAGEVDFRRVSSWPTCFVDDRSGHSSRDPSVAAPPSRPALRTARSRRSRGAGSSASTPTSSSRSATTSDRAR